MFKHWLTCPRTNTWNHWKSASLLEQKILWGDRSPMVESQQESRAVAQTEARLWQHLNRPMLLRSVVEKPDRSMAGWECSKPLDNYRGLYYSTIQDPYWSMLIILESHFDSFRICRNPSLPGFLIRFARGAGASTGAALIEWHGGLTGWWLADNFARVVCSALDIVLVKEVLSQRQAALSAREESVANSEVS